MPNDSYSVNVDSAIKLLRNIKIFNHRLHVILFKTGIAIKNLGFSRITCRPQSKRRNQALTNEFIAEIKKKTPKS